MRLADKTWATVTEETSVEYLIGVALQDLLTKLKLDTYNQTYVIRVSVDQVDNPNE